MACKDCKKDEKLSRCEVHNPPATKICKDCCISKFSGHKCAWWDICWG